MRLAARMPDSQQVSFLIDTLKNMGLSRKDMIICNLDDQQQRDNKKEVLKEEILIQTKTESISIDSPETYTEGINDLQNMEGILVVVEIPRHSIQKVKAVMEKSGALEIIRD